MRSYCAIYVDAGYLLASVATRVTGTSLRSGVQVDHDHLIRSMIDQAERSSGLPLLRVNWYDAASGGQPDATQHEIGVLPRVKLRLGRLSNAGEQKGVDLRIGLDIAAHARNRAVDLMFLVTGDDDLTEAVEEAQSHGVQVILLVVPDAEGRPHGVSRHLRLEADNVEVIDAQNLDASVHTTASRSALSGPLRIPTPAELAARALSATSSASAVPAHTPPPLYRMHPVYSTVTGQASAQAAEERPPEEIAQAAEQVSLRVLETWLPQANEEQIARLKRFKPSIPTDLDGALLRDMSSKIGEYYLEDQTRIDLRRAFWECFERVVD